MSHRDDPLLSPGEREALDALRSLERPPVDDPLRRAGWEAFRTGRRTASRPGSPMKTRPGPSMRAVWGWPLAAAALALALAGAWGTRPAAPWRVSDALLADGVRVEGRIPVVGGRIAAGRVTVADSAEVEFQLGDVMRLRFLGGTEARIPPGPGRWFGRSRSLEVLRGEVFGTTAGPLSFRFHLETTEARALVAGTTFAVFRVPGATPEADATCFCLYEGRLEITSPAGPVAITPGHRVFVYADGRLTRPEPLPAREVMKLSMMRDGGVPPLPRGP